MSTAYSVRFVLQVLRQWPARMEILSVGCDPIDRNFMPGCCQIKLATPHHPPQLISRRVLGGAVPVRAAVGLGPKVADVAGAAPIGGWGGIRIGF